MPHGGLRDLILRLFRVVQAMAHRGPQNAVSSDRVAVHASHRFGRLHPKSTGDAGSGPAAASALELPKTELAALCRQRMAGFAAVVSEVGHAVGMDGYEVGLQRPTSRLHPGQPGEFLGARMNFQ